MVMDAVRDQYRSLRMLWVDTGYQGMYWKWLHLDRGLTVDIVPRRPRRAWRLDPTIHPPLTAVPWRGPSPRRWVVERTFAWIGRYRRFSNDYEYLPATSEALIYAAMSHRMVRRLARGGQAACERRGRLRQLPLPVVAG
jgi:putative transposase